MQWHQTLAKPGSGPRTAASAGTQVEAWWAGPDLRHVLRIDYAGRRTGAARLSWGSAPQALAPLETAGFGKRRLRTAQHDWSTAERSLASRGQRRAEAVCRPLQEVAPLAVRPPYHWTAQQVRVPPCVWRMALRLCRRVERESRAAGAQGALSRLRDLRGSLRLAMGWWPAETPRGHPRWAWGLADRDPAAWDLSHRVVPPVPPFVSTSVAGENARLAATGNVVREAFSESRARAGASTPVRPDETGPTERAPEGISRARAETSSWPTCARKHLGSVQHFPAVIRDTRGTCPLQKVYAHSQIKGSDPLNRYQDSAHVDRVPSEWQSGAPDPSRRHAGNTHTPRATRGS